MRSDPSALGGFLLLGFSAAAGIAQVDASAPGAYRVETKLELDPRRLDFEGTRKHMMMYMPSSAELTSERPDGIRAEPDYRVEPRYATVQVGNGSVARFVIAVDEPADAEPRIWLDLDGDGDLTDDNDGSWESCAKGEGGTFDCRGTWLLAASWKGAGADDARGAYGLNFYYSPQRSQINYYRAAARIGKVSLGGKAYEVTLIENDNDGRFDKLFEPGQVVDGPLPSKPVWLMLDGDRFDIRGTFSFDGMNLLARVSDDGSRLAIEPSFRVIEIPKPRARPKLISAGEQAPDFRAMIWRDGEEHEFELSDFRGDKVVVLDMWATWCGPCRRGMPHLSRIAEAAAGEDVEIIALNVFDEREPYERFRAENEEKFAFTWARDPAGKESDASFAKRDYRVSGIPATFVVDKDGKIAEVISGYEEGDKRLENALRKLGIELD